MKLHFICDRNGKIAAIHAGSVSGPQASISVAGVQPGAGQTLHVIEVYDEIKSLSLADIHRQFSIKMTAGKAILTRTSGRSTD